MIGNPKNLMMSISNCDEIERAKEDSNHPCHKIVHYQYIENRRKAFQHPEPWNGNIEKADILFVGSNPSIDFDEYYPTIEQLISYMIMAISMMKNIIWKYLGLQMKIKFNY